MTQHDVDGSVPALRTSRLRPRYGRVWGLRDCTLEVPAGAVAALSARTARARPRCWR